MWHLFLDESGDLGFDFSAKSPSNFFVITVLAVRTKEHVQQLKTAVKRTLKKINHKRKKTSINELKGAKLALSFKKYFLSQMNFPFAIYSIILNKKKVFASLTHDKSRIYNYVARLLIEKLPFEKADHSIHFFIDKSKTKPEIDDFNSYIQSHLEGRLAPEVNLDISHEDSTRIAGLQVSDLFAHGIFRKYEMQDEEWYDCFKNDIVFEELYFNRKEPT